LIAKLFQLDLNIDMTALTPAILVWGFAGTSRSLWCKVPQRTLHKLLEKLPGDVIATGTPHGVGAFRDPPIWLKQGDVVTVEVEGLGSLINRCAVSE
jgi:hypothetical protein